MRLYPDTADDRGRAVARDALTLLALIVLAWLAIKVHDAVDHLAVLGTGVRDSGEVVQTGFDSAGDAGEGTGGNVADAGREGEEKAHELADLLGVLFFPLPASILLALTLPARIRQVRE